MQETQQKKESSYLGKVKGELLEIIVANHAADSQDAAEIVEDLWPFVRKASATSYWNGVRDGASGKVKPKQGRTSPKHNTAQRRYNAEGKQV